MLLDPSDRLDVKPLPSATVDALAREARTPLLVYLDAVQDCTADVREIARCVAAHIAAWIYPLGGTESFTAKFDEFWPEGSHNWRGVRTQAYGELATEISYVLKEQFGLMGAGPPKDRVLPNVVFGRYRISREETATLANALVCYRQKLQELRREEELNQGQARDFDNIEKLINTLSHVRMEAAHDETLNEAQRKKKED